MKVRVPVTAPFLCTADNGYCLLELLFFAGKKAKEDDRLRRQKLNLQLMNYDTYCLIYKQNLVFEKGFKNDFNQDFPFVCKQADLLNELTPLKSGCFDKGLPGKRRK
jgi:hypothetical protein